MGSLPPADPGKYRTLSPDAEERRQAAALLLSVGAGGCASGLRRLLQQRAIPRGARERDARRCLLREEARGSLGAREDQDAYNEKAKEGVPGRKGGLAEKPEPSLSESHPRSESS